MVSGSPPGRSAVTASSLFFILPIIIIIIICEPRVPISCCTYIVFSLSHFNPFSAMLSFIVYTVPLPVPVTHISLYRRYAVK